MPLDRPYQPPIRSLLFVPGNKLDWMLKAPKYGADALILDLEDAVPPDHKASARPLVRQAIEEIARQDGPRLFVRINHLSTGLARDDLEAVITTGLFGIQAPKTDGPEEVHQLDAWIADLERRAGLPEGQIFLMPMIETAHGVRQAYDMAMAAQRVGYLMAAAGGNMGDMALSVGFREVTGNETSYILSKVVVDARAAGVTNPCGGITSAPLRDLDAVRAHAERLRNFGYMGANLIHPSHIPIANEVFGYGEAELAYWRGLIAAVEEGERNGTSAVVYDGRMVDIAHAHFASEILKRAGEYGS